MSFTQNYQSQRDIINKIIILTKIGTDTIYSVIPNRYQNYTSTTIPKHAIILAKLNK